LYIVLLALSLTVSAAILVSCSEDDPLEPSVSVSGRVTNDSGETGNIWVEITRNKRVKATPAGNYVLPVHKDFYVDSLYAYVDVSANNQYDQGEPYGFYHSSGAPDVARPIHLRSQSVPNVNITIP
jgi:hypothetical protein